MRIKKLSLRALSFLMEPTDYSYTKADHMGIKKRGGSPLS